jgi:MOSC domain-containing protein YiiM
MGSVKAICISERKGTQKSNIHKGRFVKAFGIEDDAHGGDWHRQVSLLSYEKFMEFKSKGADINFGAFGENLVVSGIDFKELPIGTKFKCNNVLLELTQIGKECHNHCQIYSKMGDCIMPKEGVFCRVLSGGWIMENEEFCVL